MRFVDNDRISFNNLPNYSYSRNTLLGLGAISTANVLAFMQSRYGATVKLSSATNVTNAFGAHLGLINQYGATYNFGADGKAFPSPARSTKSFGTQEYEVYAQDTFKWKRNFTVTYGIRYSIDSVPYERNGIEVVSQTSLSQFFADRVGGQSLGIPNSRAAHRLRSPTLSADPSTKARLLSARQQQLRAAPLPGLHSRWRRPARQDSSAKAACSASAPA